MFLIMLISRYYRGKLSTMLSKVNEQVEEEKEADEEKNEMS
jgi:hypothetical protein